MSVAVLGWRLASTADVPALAALYGDAARTLGPQVYTPEQVQAWQSFAYDDEGFRRYVLEATTWIAAGGDGDAPLGFCGIALHGGCGEVHSLYVRAALSRRGIGTQLLAHALAHARAAGATRFEAWATPFSQPLFARAGFALAASVVEPYRGVLFERYRMAAG